MGVKKAIHMLPLRETSAGYRDPYLMEVHTRSYLSIEFLM